MHGKNINSQKLTDSLWAISTPSTKDCFITQCKCEQIEFERKNQHQSSI